MWKAGPVRFSFFSTVGAPAVETQSYRALMLAFRSLMISATSGLLLMSFSTRSMECMTVVWSRLSNSLPISFRDRLVIRRIWYMAIWRASAVSLVRPWPRRALFSML